MTLLLRERTRSLIDQLEAEHDWETLRHGPGGARGLTSPVRVCRHGTPGKSIFMVDNKVHGAVDRATDSNGFEYAARVGYGTSGVLHPDHRPIVLRLAFGSGGNADRRSASPWCISVSR